MQSKRTDSWRAERSLTVAVPLLLILVGLSGCLDLSPDELETPPETKPSDPPAIPPRFFEPAVVFETALSSVDQGADVVFSFYVTDLHDYDFPLSFIDWYIFYDRDPNPVAEGDALALPGIYNRTLFAEGYHMFAFHADDALDFEGRQLLIIQVGDPEGPAPDAAQIKEFNDRIDDFVALVEVEKAAEIDPFEGVIYDHEWWVLADDGCPGCYEEGGSLEGCGGLAAGVNDIDCSWVLIGSRSIGHAFEVRSTTITGDPGSPDVEFLTECSTEGTRVQSFIDEDPDSDVVVGVIPPKAGCLVAFDSYSASDDVGSRSEGTADGAVASVAGEEIPAPPDKGGIYFEFVWTEDAGPFQGLDVTLTTYTSCAEVEDTCDPAEGGCEGLRTREMGVGCVWVELEPNSWGQEYYVSGVVDDDGVGSSDPAGHFLSECSHHADWIGPDFDSFISEAGEVPEKAGCMMVYEYFGTANKMRIQIAAA